VGRTLLSARTAFLGTDLDRGRVRGYYCLPRQTNIEMDRQPEKAKAEAESNTGAKGLFSSGHLMCHTPLWGVAGFLGCAYFTWVSFAHVTRHEYEWPHDLWTAATYIVWIILLLGLSLDTRCLRERLFFGLLVVNFAAGCVCGGGGVRRGKPRLYSRGSN